MAKSDNLRKAKEAKNDEFYTRLEDIEAEISQHPDYVKQFEGKTVFCNCDDPEWSNFFKFFTLHFKQLKLKKLIATHFNSDGSPSYKIEWAGEMLNDNTVNLIKKNLLGNGDFRSEECIELLKEAYIVVTNPPFSLYREYIAQLIQYGKKFVIIGNNNSIAYKEVFPLLKNGSMFLGYHSNETMIMRVGEGYKYDQKVTDTINDGYKYGKIPAISWFTNLDLDKAHEPLILTKNYYGNESYYPRYENYDAIECGKVKDIPKDYLPCWYKCEHAGECTYAKTEGKEDKALCEMACNGEIGVPITYMANHCSEQFEIKAADTEVANTVELENGEHRNGRFYINAGETLDKDNNTNIIAQELRSSGAQEGKMRRLYSRLVIRRKKV